MKAQELDFDWSCLPKWANWIAMRSDGVWMWSVNKMTIIGGDWESLYNVDSQDLSYIPTKYAPKNFTEHWEESLFKVPEK